MTCRQSRPKSRLTSTYKHLFTRYVWFHCWHTINDPPVRSILFNNMPFRSTTMRKICSVAYFLACGIDTQTNQWPICFLWTSVTCLYDCWGHSTLRMLENMTRFFPLQPIWFHAWLGLMLAALAKMWKPELSLQWKSNCPNDSPHCGD